MARRARSILKALCSKPLASRSKKSAARVNVVWLAACPRSAVSADGSRQGLVRNAPERQTGLFDRVSFELQRSRDRYERERIGEATADFQVGVICRKNPF